MKIEINLSDNDVNSALSKSLEKYLSTSAGQQHINKVIDKKVNDFLSERKLRDIVQERVSRLITQDFTKDITSNYTWDDFNNRLEQIVTKVIIESKTFKESLKETIKGSIKIG